MECGGPEMSGRAKHILLSYILMRRMQGVWTSYVPSAHLSESVVCGLASHTSLSDSLVTHISFFPLQLSLPSSWISERFGVFGIIVFISVLINDLYDFYIRLS